MTNFEGSSARGITREQVLLWAPVLLGGMLAAAAGALLLVPSLQQLQRDQVELLDLKQQEARVPSLRLQLSKQLENLQEAQIKGSQILQLIAGSGDISTFMAQLSQEARRSGVQLDSYEPVTTIAASTTTNAPAATSQQTAAKPPEGIDPKQPPSPPVDPLLAPGLQKTSLLITARGQGSQLNQFLRRLESLSLLVVQSDLAVKYEPGPAAANGKPPAAGVTTLKLNLALYSKAAVGSTPPEPSPSSAPAKS
jgi:type IV pilus assembly protein PilO